MFQRLQLYFRHPPSLIIGIGFSTLSLLMSTWAIRLPALKAQLGFDDAQIGTALLILSIGSLAISPFSSYIMDRYPTGQVSFISIILLVGFYCFPFLSDQYTLFLLAMFSLGLAMGFVNITLNASAAIVEKRYQRSIMSICHAMFSIGAILGSIGAGLIASFGISPIWHMFGMITFLLVINILLYRIWFSIPDTDLKAPVFALPSLPILGYFTITFCLVLAELTIMEWSAVYLNDTLKSPAAFTGWGFAGFSITMAIGRLSGNVIIPKLGKQKIIVGGATLSAFGIGIAASTNWYWVAILGFTITGAGMAVIIPLIYSLSAKMKTVSPGLGIASIATACVLGGLVGRPLAGWISNSIGMSFSMWIAAGFALLAAGIGLFFKR